MEDKGPIWIKLRRKGGGDLAEMMVPRTLRQVPLNRFIDFLIECRALNDPGQNQLMTMAKAISGFCDFPLAEILEAEIGDVYAPEIRGLDKSLRSIFGYIAHTVHSAQGNFIDPENAFFVHKGQKYVIPTITQQALAGEFNLPFMSVIEVIEASEVQRFKMNKTKQVGDPEGRIRKKIIDLANEQIAPLKEDDPRRLVVLKSAETVANSEIERAGDPNGSLLYTMYMKTLAVISRKEGEQLPFDDAEREAWINDRAMEFRGISAQTALDVDFFLSSILNIYENDHPAIGFLTRQTLQLLAAIRLSSKKSKTGKRSTTRRYSVV